MRRRSIVIVLYALLLTLGSYVLYTYYCQKKKAKAAFKEFTSIKHAKDQNFESTSPTILLQNLCLESDRSQKNTLQWSLKSQQCSLYHSHEKVMSNNIDCQVTYQDIIGYLHGPKAIFDLKSKNLFLAGTITGSIHEIRISGQDICYSPNLNLIETDKPITLIHKNFTLNAQKTVAFLGENKRIELGGVTTTIFSVSGLQQAP